MYKRQVVTKRPPTEEELTAMRFNWRVVKQVHSNAIVFGGTDRTLGIGAGQMSRVDSARIAVWKAGQAGLDLKGSVVASDAMFPFADGLQVAIDAGATACIQPGGSIRDEEVIAAADAAGIADVYKRQALPCIRNCVTGTIPTRKPACTAASGIFSTSFRARSFPIRTCWTLKGQPS